MACKKIEPNSGLPELGLIENLASEIWPLVNAGLAVMTQPFDFVLHQ